MAITKTSVVVPVEYSTEIIRGVLGKSKALELGRRLPDMKGNTYKLNVLQTLPVAGWVANSTTPANAESTEIKNKSISALAWEGKDIIAEEIAVIVPIAISTLEDVENFGVEVIPTITEEVVGAFQQVIDATIFFGTNTPFTAVGNIVGDATTAGAVVEWDGDGTKFYDAINDAMSLVEASGYVPTAIVGGPTLAGAFRSMRTSTGQQINGGEIVDFPRHIDLTGGFNADTAFAVVGDFRYLVYSLRQDMRMKVLEESTLKDPTTGADLYNLGQQDMIALRFTMRMGYQLPNPVNRVSGVLSSDGKYVKAGASAYPFALIKKVSD